MNDTKEKTTLLVVRSNAGLGSADEQTLEYFKSLAQRLCEHRMCHMENEDGSRFLFCKICTIKIDEA